MTAENVVAFVFARGGSTGVPDKNLRRIGGVPLIGRAVRSALAAPSIERVVISTDSQEIADVAESYGADVPWLRPSELATSEVSEWLAWQHAVDHVETAAEPIDLFVSVPATAPLRSPDDVEAAIALYRADQPDLVITVCEASSSPFFDLVCKAADKELSFVVPEGGTFTRRQDAPPVFELTPVAYVTTPEHIRTSTGVFDGRVLGSVVPRERAVDIDTNFDLAFAEFLHSRSEQNEVVA